MPDRASLHHATGARRRTPLRLAALAAVVGCVLAVAPSASAHSGPPTSTWHRCTGTVIFSGDSWQSVGGVVYATKNSITQYYVRIRPALPFGWSGTAVLSKATAHPSVWVPAGTTHWFPSPAIITAPTNGTYGINVSVRPNLGVFNNYGVEVWTPYACRYWAN